MIFFFHKKHEKLEKMVSKMVFFKKESELQSFPLENIT